MSQSGTPSPFASTGERIACSTVTCTFALAIVRLPIMVRLEAQRLIIVHLLPGVRMVRGIRERIVVGAPIHDAKVGEVPGGRRRVRLERLVEPGDAGVVGTQVRR